MECQHDVTQLRNGKYKHRCIHCKRVRISIMPNLTMECGAEKREVRTTSCVHRSEKPEFEEECKGCHSTKVHPAYWCSKLNLVCAETFRLPYKNCNLCPNYQAGA